MHITGNQNLNGVKIIPEGSGADTKYYAQQGADAASKKLLGRPAKIISLRQHSEEPSKNQWIVTELKIDTSDCNHISFGAMSGSYLPRITITITGSAGQLYTGIGTSYAPATYDVSAHEWVSLIINCRYTEDNAIIENILTD